MAAHEPRHHLIRRYNTRIQSRQYKPMTVAEIKFATAKKAKTKNLMRQGFKVLANYIFGDNIKKQKIAMTAPVINYWDKNNKFTVRFILPETITQQSAPAPNNTNINIYQQEKTKSIHITFSGFGREKKFLRHEKKLRQFCKEKKIDIKKIAYHARYNPPWTLPFLKRNEVFFLLNNT